MINKLRLAIRNDLEAEEEARAFGSGWFSGVLGLALSGAALLLLISQQYPAWFSVAELEAVHRHPLYMLIVQGFALIGFALACVNLILRRNKVIGFSAIFLVLMTLSLGWIGSRQPGSAAAVNLGIDWFVLNLLLKGVLFIPLEKLFSGPHKQPLFRAEWREDLFYFLISSLFVQVMAFLSLMPSLALMKQTENWAGFRALVAAQPFILQIVELMIVSDFMQYAFHRAFHAVPFLWRFHAVHHSAQTMDWMAGSRMHLIEILLLRGFTIIPMYMLGFSQGALYSYIFFVYLVSAYVHANLRFNDAWLSSYVVTPRFHHWHHGIEKEAIDVNFAVHFPWIDKIFSTHYLPKNGQWPSGYGIAECPVPNGYWKQLIYPFRKTSSE